MSCRIVDIEIADHLDSDGDIELYIECPHNYCDRDLYRYINKEQAQTLITHLIKVFELDDSNG